MGLSGHGKFGTKLPGGWNAVPNFSCKPAYYLWKTTHDPNDDYPAWHLCRFSKNTGQFDLRWIENSEGCSPTIPNISWFQALENARWWWAWTFGRGGRAWHFDVQQKDRTVGSSSKYMSKFRTWCDLLGHGVFRKLDGDISPTSIIWATRIGVELEQKLDMSEAFRP